MRSPSLVLFLSFGLTVFGRGWSELHDNCTAISFSELKGAPGNLTSRFSIGPKGLYAEGPTGECVFIDGSKHSQFAQENPDVHGAFINWVEALGPVTNQLEFLKDAEKHATEGTLVARAADACGNICDGSSVTRVNCMDIACINCIIVSQGCYNTDCWYLSQCRG